MKRPEVNQQFSSRNRDKNHYGINIEHPKAETISPLLCYILIELNLYGSLVFNIYF